MSNNLAKIDKLRPTQITVGMREVDDKCNEVRGLKGDPVKFAAFLAAHVIPVVSGLDDHQYVVDHHHLGLALHKAGIEQAPISVIGDLSTLPETSFWAQMAVKGWVHPYDQNGQKQAIGDLPKHVDGLIDDPYRSLAGYVRNAGGYQKTPAPFAEFQWADFFRKRIAEKDLDKHFKDGVKTAIAMAKSADAKDLPGWLGGK